MKDYYVVRTDRAGVFCGEIVENKGTSIVMKNVRKIYYWQQAAAVEQISQTGVGIGSQLTVTIPQMEIASPIQVIPCTDEATKNLKNFEEWKM